MWTVIIRQFNSSEHHKSRKCTAGVKVHLTPNFVFCWNESTCYLRYFCETMFGLGLSIFSIFYFRNLRNSSKTSPFKITIQNSPLVVFTAFICLLLHLVSSFLFIKNYSPSSLEILHLTLQLWYVLELIQRADWRAIVFGSWVDVISNHRNRLPKHFKHNFRRA